MRHPSVLLRSFRLLSHSLTAPFLAQDVAVLPTLVACRLACSATMGTYSYTKDPTNEYLLEHSKPAWTSLKQWLALDRTTLATALAAAAAAVAAPLS